MLKLFRAGTICVGVNALYKEVADIFETACEAAGENCDWAIAISPDGGIHMMPAAGWNIEPLRLHLGAAAAYRVIRRNGQVEVEARSQNQSCRLRSEEPRRWMAGAFEFPRYITA